MNVRMWVLSELFSVFIYLFIFYPLFDIQNNKPHWTFKKCSDAKAEWLQTAAETENAWEPVFKQMYLDAFHRWSVVKSLPWTDWPIYARVGVFWVHMPCI